MDAGMLGEHIIKTLVDAWDRLLLPPCPNLYDPKEIRRHGIVIPYGGTIYTAGIQCPFIARGSFVSPERWDTLGLGELGLRLAKLPDEEYDSDDLVHLPGGYMMLTSPKEVLNINFNDPKELKSHLANQISKQVSVKQ